MTSDVVIAMPVYNEAEGLPKFLSELVQAFDGVKLSFWR